MPRDKHFARVDTRELKSQIEKKIGSLKAEKYLHLLSKFLSSKINKSEFDKLCISTIGRQNIRLHNSFLRAIIKNVCLFRSPPTLKGDILKTSLSVKKLANGFQSTISFQSLSKDLPQSPRKGRTQIIRDRKFKDLKGKSLVTSVSNQPSASDLLSLGGRSPCSVEDGEEVDQSTGSPGTHSRNHPIEAPLGINLSKKTGQKVLSNRFASGYYQETCYGCGELPDTSSLKKRLEQNLGMEEGCEVSMEFTTLLNTGLDVFLKRLIKPCLELAGSGSRQNQIHGRPSSSAHGSNRLCPKKCEQVPRASVSASLVDFKVAMDLNPLILGQDWPAKLEKIRLTL